MASMHPALLLPINIQFSTPKKDVHRGHILRTRCSASKDSDSQENAAPWELTPYFTKKKNRELTPQGNFVDSLENTAEWFAWDLEAKLRLSADSLSPALGVSPSELLANAKLLGPFIPGGDVTLDKLKPAEVIRLAAQVDDVPAWLITLREVLPESVDVNWLVQKWPEILLFSTEKVAEGYKAVQQQFEEAVGASMVGSMLETTPQLLDERVLKACMRGAGHLMPLAQLASSLARYDDYYMQFQSLENEPRNDYDELLNDVDYYLNENVGTASGIRHGRMP